MTLKIFAALSAKRYGESCIIRGEGSLRKRGEESFRVGDLTWWYG